jgi:hypothetical protein
MVFGVNSIVFPSGLSNGQGIGNRAYWQSLRFLLVAGSDVNMRRGTYPFQKKPPLTPGYSMVGEVLDNGVGCTRFAPGTLVACLTIYGVSLAAPHRYRG